MLHKLLIWCNLLIRLLSKSKSPVCEAKPAAPTTNVRPINPKIGGMLKPSLSTSCPKIVRVKLLKPAILYNDKFY